MPERRRSSICLAAPRTDFLVLYDDSKNYWKERVSLDIVLVLHPATSCIEVVMFNRELDLKAPHIYLDQAAVIRSLDKEELLKKIVEKKEGYIRQKLTFNAADVEKEASNEATVQYVLSRLRVDPSAATGSSTTGAFSLLLVPDMVDSLEGRPHHCMISKPELLVPVPCAFTSKLQQGAVSLALADLQSATAGLQRAVGEAELAAAGAEKLRAAGAEKLRAALAERTRREHSATACRQRWLRATRRVLFRLRVEKVRARLEASASSMAAQDGLAVGPGQLFTLSPSEASPQRPGKFARRSFDGGALPSIKSRNAKVHKVESLGLARSTSTHAPLTQVPKRPLVRDLPPIVDVARDHSHAKVAHAYTRKSFHGGDEPSAETLRGLRFMIDPSSKATAQHSPLAFAKAAPSIAASFAEISSKQSKPLSEYNQHVGLLHSKTVRAGRKT